MAAAESQQTRDSSENMDNNQEFQKISRKSKNRKRRIEVDHDSDQMDSCETIPKRPMLPPVSADKISVSKKMSRRHQLRSLLS